MHNAIIFNTTNQQLLATEGTLANTFFTRLKGWLGKKVMPDSEGLIISPCTQVHSFGMKIVIDVLFLSKNNEIVYIMERMIPNKISPNIKNAHYVIELPAGQVLRTGTAVGHIISIV